MPDWIDDQMAGAGPEATLVFGRNAQIAAIAEGRAEWVKPTLSGSSQWPSSDRKGRKSCRCARRASIQTAAQRAGQVQGGAYMPPAARWKGWVASMMC